MFQIATKVTFNRQPNALRSFDNELARNGERGGEDEEEIPLGGRGEGDPPRFRNLEHKMGGNMVP